MTKEIKTSIIIKAKPENVWKVFTDFKEYPSWNPFIKSLEGELEEGKKIKVKTSKASFKSRILACTKNKELVWTGSFMFKGLFDGEHRFILKYNGRGTTLFEQSEEFNGVLVKAFNKKIDGDIKKGFEEMNQKLKEEVEKKFPYSKKKKTRKYYPKKDKTKDKPQSKTQAKTQTRTQGKTQGKKTTNHSKNKQK